MSVCVCGGGGVRVRLCVRACVYALRRVSTNKIVRFIDTFLLIIVIIIISSSSTKHGV